jgi:valyl-tRNA synthetase
LRQDTDVLDTWFSSGLWPFSTLGWPDKTEDLAKYYPTSLLITGFDILFFWVARMVMLGCEFMGEIPFRQVYIHGLVRDADRQKMSKTKGNVIDPLVVTEKYGTDAVRMALLQGAAPGTDIVLTEERMESSRAFANKIWNAARFLFMNMERSGIERVSDLVEAPLEENGEVPVEDRWIFARLNATAEQLNRSIEQYRYHEVAQGLWSFFWHEFCDWYLELKKLRFQENSGVTPGWRNTMSAFEYALRLLHPAMPFLTEELWQRLEHGEGAPKSIALAPYPQPDPKLADADAEREIGIIQEIVTKIRTMRAYAAVDNPNAKASAKYQLSGVIHLSEKIAAPAKAHQLAIEKLANVALEFQTGHAVPAAAGEGRRSTVENGTLTLRDSEVEFDLELRAECPKAEVDPAAEAAQRKRLEKEREQLEKNIANSKRQLSDEVFLSKAPQKVVDSIRAKLADYEAQLAKLS